MQCPAIVLRVFMIGMLTNLEFQATVPLDSLRSVPGSLRLRLHYRCLAHFSR
jgi:hypothetical protein